MLAFDSKRALQAFKDNHRGTTSAPVHNLRAGERRILPGDTEPIGLMAGGAVGGKYLLTFFCRRQLGRLFGAGVAACFGRDPRRAAEVIEPVPANTLTL